MFLIQKNEDSHFQMSLRILHFPKDAIQSWEFPLKKRAYLQGVPLISGTAKLSVVTRQPTQPPIMLIHLHPQYT